MAFSQKLSQQQSLLCKGGRGWREKNPANQSITLLLKLNFNWVNIAFSSHFLCKQDILNSSKQYLLLLINLCEGMDKELKAILSYSQSQSVFHSNKHYTKRRINSFSFFIKFHNSIALNLMVQAHT